MTRLTVEQVKLGELRPYPGNARRGDVDAIASSLEAHGQFRPLIVQRSTGYVLGGNHTLQAAQRLGWPSVQVTYLDVDDDAAKRIVLADNRTHDLGDGYDDRALADLLASIDGDLTGTGFSFDDLDDLLAKLDEETPTPGTVADPTVLIPGGPTNVRSTPSLEEYASEYGARATRFFALIYPLAQYAWVEEKLTKLAAEFGYDNNSDTLLRLLADRIGEEAPAADAEPDPAGE